MSLEGLPPSRHISSTPTTLSSASRMLETYLTNSEAHPHLHPDALITPTGVTFSSHGGPSGGVVMHNLRRVAAGLRGEYLEPESTPEPEEEQDDSFGVGKKGGKKDKRKRDGQGDVQGWQDKADYEREEGLIEIGELGERTNVVQDGGEEPDVEVAEGSVKKRRKDQVDAGGKLDKEARKKAKKERDLQRKRENAEKNAGKA